MYVTLRVDGNLNVQLNRNENYDSRSMHGSGDYNTDVRTKALSYAMNVS